MNDIKDIIQQSVDACELKLYGIEKSDGGYIIYIENEDNSVSIHDCEMVMKQLTYSTDTDHLHLEVSSKGLYPPILKLEHYQKSVGQWIKIRTGKKTYKGELTHISDDAVHLKKDEHLFDVPLSDIQSARLVPEPKGE